VLDLVRSEHVQEFAHAPRTRPDRPDRCLLTVVPARSVSASTITFDLRLFLGVRERPRWMHHLLLVERCENDAEYPDEGDRGD
jgi:hypothetical protein